MAIDDQALKDALRAIESGEIPEDLDLPDPEEYDDMGGIKSLDQNAPSIKMASEPGEDEAVLEISQMLEAYEDAVKQGFQGTVKEFSEYYFGQMKQDMQMNEDRAMAMYGGSMRAKYNDGTPLPMKKKYNFMELVDSSNDALEEELLDRKYNAKNYPPSQRGMSMEELKKMLDKAKKDKLKRAKGGIAGVL